MPGILFQASSCYFSHLHFQFLISNLPLIRLFILLMHLIQRWNHLKCVIIHATPRKFWAVISRSFFACLEQTKYSCLLCVTNNILQHCNIMNPGYLTLESEAEKTYINLKRKRRDLEGWGMPYRQRVSGGWLCSWEKRFGMTVCWGIFSSKMHPVYAPSSSLWTVEHMMHSLLMITLVWVDSPHQQNTPVWFCFKYRHGLKIKILPVVN